MSALGRKRTLGVKNPQFSSTRAGAPLAHVKPVGLVSFCGSPILRVQRGKQDPQVAPNTTERILRITAVLERTGLTRSTLYRKIHGGTFPRQVRISTRCAGWYESAVNAWLQNPMFYSASDQPASESRESTPRRRARVVGLTSCSDEPMLPLGFDACRRSPSADTPPQPR